MGAVLARRGTRKYSELIERLVLDFEGHGLHTDEHPDPWAEQHEVELAAAVASFRALTGRRVDLVGYCEDDALTWLGCTPHALVDADAVLYARCRQHLRTLRERAAQISTAEHARVQVLLHVTGRAHCHVFDFWDSHSGGLYDQTHVQMVLRDREYFDAVILPRCTQVWADVGLRLNERRTPIVA
jgi:hypothetical protein